MKKWIATLLTFVLLLGVLSGCKQEELDLTPDDKMTIAISALARSVTALRAQSERPVRYTVSSVRTLNGDKTMEVTSSYDTEELLTVIQTRNYDGVEQLSSQTEYTFVKSLADNFQIISAEIHTEGDMTTKTYRVLHTLDTWQEVQSVWAENSYGADMTYQTYGRLEKLIVDAALSQGGAEAKVTSAKDFTLVLTRTHRTETYKVEDNLISQWVWAEWTANGEDENTWNYYWNITDVTLPDLADFVLIAE